MVIGVHEGDLGGLSHGNADVYKGQKAGRAAEEPKRAIYFLSGTDAGTFENLPSRDCNGNRKGLGHVMPPRLLRAKDDIDDVVDGSSDKREHEGSGEEQERKR